MSDNESIKDDEQKGGIDDKPKSSRCSKHMNDQKIMFQIKILKNHH